MIAWKQIGLIIVGILIAGYFELTMCAFGCTPDSRIPNYVGSGIGVLLFLLGLYLTVAKYNKKEKTA